MLLMPVGESMSIGPRFGMLLPLLLCAAAGSAQQSAPAVQPDPATRIYLDVVVTPKDGAPVAELRRQDFTVLDNKAPQVITSFQALGGDSAPVEVIVVVDAVNTGYQTIAFERGQIDKFLRANGGHLAYPTAMAIVTDTGTQMQNNFSQDGNSVSAALDQFAIGLRDLRRSSGFYGADERVQISIQALRLLAAREATRPGRKIVLWISPGWPLLTGPHIDLGMNEQRRIFKTIVSLSTELRQSRITLYSVDPLGAADAASERLFYYKDFVKGIRKPSQVDLADLSLQVLATQTGGLAVNSSNDVAALLQKCMTDIHAYYELSFDPAPGENDEYHSIDVRVAKPGLIARTRSGYYSEP